VDLRRGTVGFRRERACDRTAEAAVAAAAVACLKKELARCSEGLLRESFRTEVFARARCPSSAGSRGGVVRLLYRRLWGVRSIFCT
jgi:hypothetical protein